MRITVELEIDTTKSQRVCEKCGCATCHCHSTDPKELPRVPDPVGPENDGAGDGRRREQEKPISAENRHAESGWPRIGPCRGFVKRGATKIPCCLYYGHDGPCVPKKPVTR